jgi:hypothetical protein
MDRHTDELPDSRTERLEKRSTGVPEPPILRWSVVWRRDELRVRQLRVHTGKAIRLVKAAPCSKVDNEVFEAVSRLRDDSVEVLRLSRLCGKTRLVYALAHPSEAEEVLMSLVSTHLFKLSIR